MFEVKLKSKLTLMKIPVQYGIQEPCFLSFIDTSSLNEKFEIFCNNYRIFIQYVCCKQNVKFIFTLLSITLGVTKVTLLIILITTV